MVRPSTKQAVVTKVHERNVAERNPLIGEPIDRIEPADDRDERDVRTSIIVGMRLDFLPGRAVDLIMEAARATGKRKAELYDLAIRDLIQERAQIIVTSVVMALALSAFPFVILKCAGIM